MYTRSHNGTSQKTAVFRYIQFDLLLFLFTFNYLIKFVVHDVMECLDSSYTSLNLFIFPFNIKLQHCNFCLQFWHFPEKIKLLQVQKYYSNLHSTFDGLQNYEFKLTGKNIPLLQDYMHSKLSKAPRDFWCMQRHFKLWGIHIKAVSTTVSNVSESMKHVRHSNLCNSWGSYSNVSEDSSPIEHTDHIYCYIVTNVWRILVFSSSGSSSLLYVEYLTLKMKAPWYFEMIAVAYKLSWNMCMAIYTACSKLNLKNIANNDLYLIQQ